MKTESAGLWSHVARESTLLLYYFTVVTIDNVLSILPATAPVVVTTENGEYMNKACADVPLVSFTMVALLTF